MPDAFLDAATRILSADHAPATSNEYGACDAPGYKVGKGIDGMVRIHHRMPEADLLDENRASDDEMADERHRMVEAYASALEKAGWTVLRRGLRSRTPYLLAI
jgi:hypothetical protein